MAELSLQEAAEAAEAVNDDAMITKIAFPELIAQEAKYHKECHQILWRMHAGFPIKKEWKQLMRKH